MPNTDTAVPATLVIRGRTFTVERVAETRDEKGYRYKLTGVRGAKYSTMRNVNHKDMMFLINERGFGIAKTIDGVWLSDKDGKLTIHAH